MPKKGMNDRLTFKASLTISLLGILLLFIYAESLTLKIRDISSIVKDDLNKQIKVSGQITSIRDLPGIIILNLKDKSSEIKVIVFKEEELELKKNNFLEIEGLVKEYQGELEIQAEKIIKK